MIHLIPVALACLAFLALAASMKRHQRDLLGRSLPDAQARMLRIAGWALIALVWIIDAMLAGPAMATLIWIGEASIGGWVTVGTINWRATRTAR